MFFVFIVLGGKVLDIIIKVFLKCMKEKDLSEGGGFVK